jgi:hypothetical protein
MEWDAQKQQRMEMANALEQQTKEGRKKTIQAKTKRREEMQERLRLIKEKERQQRQGNGTAESTEMPATTSSNAVRPSSSTRQTTEEAEPYQTDYDLLRANGIEERIIRDRQRAAVDKLSSNLEWNQ